MTDLIEKAAERVHDAYLDACWRLGWTVKPENRIPYADLSDDSKELDRASVYAVLQVLHEQDMLAKPRRLDAAQ